jgi:hypothetical protein
MPAIRKKARELLADEAISPELPQSEPAREPRRLLWGANAIARYVFDDADQPKKVQDLNRRRVYDLAEAGDLPTFHMAGTLCALPDSIDRRFAEREFATGAAIRALKTAAE